MPKVGRPKEPNSKVTKWAMWKRAQRAHPNPGGPNRKMHRHHVDDNYGRTTEKVELIPIGEHNKRRKGTKYKKK